MKKGIVIRVFSGNLEDQQVNCAYLSLIFIFDIKSKEKS